MRQALGSSSNPFSNDIKAVLPQVCDAIAQNTSQIAALHGKFEGMVSAVGEIAEAMNKNTTTTELFMDRIANAALILAGKRSSGGLSSAGGEQEDALALLEVGAAAASSERAPVTLTGEGRYPLAKYDTVLDMWNDWLG